jgi:hypothetical protein
MRELVVTATSEAGRAAVRVHEPEQDPQRGALAGAIGAEEARDLAGLGRE